MVWMVGKIFLLLFKLNILFSLARIKKEYIGVDKGQRCKKTKLCKGYYADSIVSTGHRVLEYESKPVNLLNKSNTIINTLFQRGIQVVSQPESLKLYLLINNIYYLPK